MVDINLTFADGTTLEQIIGFEVAAQIWEGYLDDDVTVNIHAEVTDELDADVLGGALPAFISGIAYEDIADAMANDATTSDDDLAVANLPNDDKGEIKIFAHGDEEVKTGEMKLTRANAKALGLSGIDPHSNTLDAYIALNDLSAHSDVHWNYRINADQIAADELDFVSVALHEMGHALGFSSGLDDPGWLTAIQNGDFDSKKNTLKISDNDSDYGNPLDLFRYTDLGLSEGKGDGQDWSIAADNPFFSIDGGVTALVEFASGENVDFADNGAGVDALGDGHQASHWKHTPESPAGIFDAALTTGVRRNLSEVDLKALDVIGWDRSTEPGSADGDIRYEAEDLNTTLLTPNAGVDGYYEIQNISGASGGQVWSLDDDVRSNGEDIDQIGALSLSFDGPNGLYNIVVRYYDENDGEAQYEFEKGNTTLDSWITDDSASHTSNTPHADELDADGFVHRTVATNLEILSGDTFTLTAFEDEHNHTRVDYIEFIPLNVFEAVHSSTDNSSTNGITGASVRIEAEDINTINTIENISAASGGLTWSVLNSPSGDTGVETFNFAGQAGFYDIVVGYFDENDGVGQLSLTQDNTLLDQWALDQDLGSPSAGSSTFTTRTVANSIQINPGDAFTLSGTENIGEHVRVDYIDFIAVEEPPETVVPTNVTSGVSLRVEAENINTINTIENISAASGGLVWSVLNSPSGDTGVETFNFTGQAGFYDIVVGYFDENDGVGQLSLTQDNTLLDQWALDQDLGSPSAGSDTFTTRTVANSIQINPGDSFTLSGTENIGEHVRVDYIDFIAVEDPPEVVTPLPTIRVESEDLNDAVYSSELLDGASGGRVRSIIKPASNDGVTHTFNGEEGLYDVIMGYYDGYGASIVTVEQNNNQIDQWTADQEVGISWQNNFQSRNVATNIQINQGDVFEFTGTLVGGDYLRVDYIDFVPVQPDSTDTTDTSGGTDATPSSVRFETEDMVLSTYDIQPDSGASGTGYIHLANYSSGTTGTADFSFNGSSGQYDVVVSYWDENDGSSTFQLDQGGTLVSEWNADQNWDPAVSITKVDRTVATGIQVNAGDNFTFTGEVDNYEFARVDYIEFIPVVNSDSSGTDTSSGSDSTDTGSGSSSGFISAHQQYFDNVVNAIASFLGTSIQNILNNLQNNYGALTEESFTDIVNDILIPNGWGSWGSGGGGGGGGGWGGGSSGSCGWGCQEFEELFHSHSFGALASDTHDHDHDDDHDHVDVLTGINDADTQSRLSRSAKFSGTNHSSTDRQGLKKQAYAGARIFNQDSSDEIAQTIERLQTHFSQSSYRSGSTNSNQGTFDATDGLMATNISHDNNNHLLMTNNADIIASLI